VEDHHWAAQLHMTLFSPQAVVIIIASHYLPASVVMLRENDAPFSGIIDLTWYFAKVTFLLTSSIND
jgi:hypothetical protein